MPDEHAFSVTVSWDPSGKEGSLASGSGRLATPFGGAPSLGGRADRTNPEELLLASLATCFVQTWSIFLAKLKLPVPAPRLDGRCELEKDPAGGWRLATLVLVPHVPAALWEMRRGDVERSLELAERYCIVSKALRGAAGPSVPIEVRPDVGPPAS